MSRTYGDHGRATFATRLWYASIALHRRGLRRTARILKAANFVAFRAILPPQAIVGDGVRLGHSALGVVIHPNTEIGDRVRIWHHVTIGSSADVGSADRVIIGDEVEIGTGAVILNKRGRTLRIGAGARIGANTTVTQDVPAGAVVVGAKPSVRLPAAQDPR